MTNKDIKTLIENEMQTVKDLCNKIQGQQDKLISELQTVKDLYIKVQDKQEELTSETQAEIEECKNSITEISTLLSDIYKKVNDTQENSSEISSLNQSISKLQKNITDSNIHIKDIQNQMRNSISQEKTFDSQNKLLLWGVYKNANQTYDEAKRQFFSKLPKAQGIMKVKQGLILHILDELDAVCKTENIPYWLDFGSMLGAVRQNGLVSWDDDIDLGMMRSDVKRLMDALETNEKIKLWNMYAIDNVNTCNLFRLFYKKYECSCFVDIFVHDFCDNLDESSWDFYLKIRRELVAKTKIYRNSQDEVTEYSSDPDGMTRKAIVDPVRIKQIDLEFEKTIMELREKIGWSEEKKEGIIWGIDNFTLLKSRRLLKQDVIFPLREISFEGRQLSIPNQSEKLLFEHYGDIYTFPQDMLLHEHIRMTEEQKYNLINIYEKECM